ncbi:MAG: mismatch repair protein MutS2 [Clostridia bacterium]|jgi:DNA mismatch repair protein MutS2|nr:mismatch repair protein MutS2 [Clostridia bacterium]
MEINGAVLEKLEFNKVLKELEKHAGSNLAKEKIKKIVPSTVPSEIEKMQQETSEARDVLRLHPNFSVGVVRDIKDIIRKAEIGVTIEPQEFLAIQDNIRTSGKIKSFFKNNEGNWSTLRKEVEKIHPVRELNQEISRVITAEGEVSENASPRLREIRRNIVATQSSIKKFLNKMINSPDIQKKLQDNLVTVRGDRYVIPVKQEYRSQIKGLVHDQSSSGATLFIEPMEVVDLNNKLRTLKSEERIEIQKILQELTDYTANFRDLLESSLHSLVNLDFIFAKANYSVQLNAVRPELNTEGIINIKKARHPLIDKAKVVPISFKLGENYNTVVITGPNTGGKTVTLKTIGLTCLMAQSGMHIPAEEESVVSIFKGIYADIGDEQSIEQSLSTFSSHMTNIIKIVEKADRESLVLLDELGAGTDPTEGAALAMAILNELHENNVRTVATTHYGQLKSFAYNTPGVQNASVEFDSETLQPTYRLLMGLPGKSNAFEISLRLGLKKDIVQKAKEFVGSEELRVSDLIQKLEYERKVSEREREKATSIRKEIDSLKKELQEKKRELENKKKEIIAKAAEEAREIIKKAQRESKEILQTLEHNKKVQEAQEKLKKMDRDLKDKSKIELTPKGKIPQNVKPGDIVEIPKLNGKGTILSTVNDDEEVQVQVGIMKINLKLKDLRVPIKDQKDDRQKKNLSMLVSEKSKTISPELDLRGNTVDEAIEKIEKYLDDAYIAGLNQVSLIHGKGTGALRSGVREYLKTHPHVRKYRCGEAAEGGSGVSIVELK